MLLFLVLVSLPVLAAVLLAGWAGHGVGSGRTFAVLAASGVVFTLLWMLLQGHGRNAQDLVFPLLVYAPPLLTAGVFLLLRRRPLSRRGVILLGTAMAALNLVMTQLLFVAGCTVSWWACP